MFAHVEVYARKRSATKRSVGEVLAEARRDPGSCSHIENPMKPAIMGGKGLDEVERIHDKNAGDAVVATGNGQYRKLRQDTPTLFTAVFSYPVPSEIVNTDMEKARAFRAWVVDTVAWIGKDTKNRGGKVLSAVLHRDERFPHLHVYAIHESGRADLLHPGRAAKAETVARMLSAGATKAQANKGGNNTYRQTMRLWLDRYWHDCASRHAQTRTGPQRKRLTRKEWTEAKAEAQLLSARIREAEEMKAVAAKQLKMLKKAAKSIGVDITSVLSKFVETPENV